jgi:membrane associated rhomboid family serine protease
MTNPFYNQPASPFDEVRRFFRQGSPLSVLILINIAVWLLVQVVRVLFFLFNKPESGLAAGWMLHLLAVPASVPVLMSKPWTLLTYMFFHVDVWHILFNVLWLYWFGRIFMEFLSGRKLLTVYLLGGLSGGVVYILAFNIFPVFQPAIPVSAALGASASVMAIVTAISFYVPDYSLQLILFGRVKIVYLAILLFIFDFFMIPSGNSGGHLAHIGGAIFGFLYTLYLKNFSPAIGKGYRNSFSTGFRDIFGNKESRNTTYQHPGERPVTDEEYNRRKNENQQRIDIILEKISKGGYDSLTREEKEFLFKTSGKR